MIIKLVLLAVFGIAMAHVEGVVVVYLREALGIDSTKDHKELLNAVPHRTIIIEQTREAATIIMLACIAILCGESWLEVAVLFLWTFAFWDLFYYVSLYAVIKWPPRLTTTDVLFLIPRPWIAPVWFPVSVSTLTIVIIVVLYLCSII